ncbi:MAG: response regulator transcription factor [Elusimicrobiota bacterium]
MEDRKRILVADDDPDLIEILKMDLSFQGYEVFEAANGKEALDIAAKEKIDLILLDVMMPYIDGYHVASTLSSQMGTSVPKIVIMTSRDTVREKGIAMMSGAVSMIQKPFDMEALHKKIKEILEHP